MHYTLFATDRHTITRHIIIITGASPSLVIFFCAVGPVLRSICESLFYFPSWSVWNTPNVPDVRSHRSPKIRFVRGDRPGIRIGSAAQTRCTESERGGGESKPKNNRERKWPSVREVDWVIYFYRRLIVFISVIPGQAWWRPTERTLPWKWRAISVPEKNAYLKYAENSNNCRRFFKFELQSVHKHVACVFTNDRNVYYRRIKSKKNDVYKTCYYFFVENAVGKPKTYIYV